MKNINWHRLFGLLLMDYLSNRGFDVELEKYRSFKRQPLDVMIVRKRTEEAKISGICDGFDNLSRHNLLSYKSKRQVQNISTFEELIDLYVNYRKVLEKDSGVNAEDIRLYAVCTNSPKPILSQLEVTRGNPGVYDLLVLERMIRIIVLSEIAMEQRNAVLNFLSFNREKVAFAFNHYHCKQKNTVKVINQLLKGYSSEGIKMPYTMKHFRKDFIMENLGEIDPDEILPMFSLEERLKGLDPEKIESYLKKLKKRKTN